MQLEVSSLVADSEVVLGHLGFGCVEGHLVASQPALIANNSGTVNGRAGKVEVHIAAKVHIFALVGCLDFATLLAVHKGESTGLISMLLCQLHRVSVCSHGHYSGMEAHALGFTVSRG